jgi:maltooligosyltrehalose trehalohydrolase
VKGFTVWAPAARSVALEIGGTRRALSPDADGYHAQQAAPPAGVDYRIVLDGERAVPDPRSERQAQGVHGPSQRLDHAAFAWTDAGFRPPPLASSLIYELHVGTFSPEGTFDGAIARLGHLVELGVTHVELMPVASFPGDRGWGYDGVALFAPHETYGGPDGLKRLVDACHARGLAVLLDVVYNHLGPDGNYLGQFGAYFNDAYSTPWGPAVNLDGPGSREVRRFFCDNAALWLRDYHFDGLRLDAVHAFFDRSAEHFLEQLVREIAELEAALGRQLVLIAESDLNDPRLVRAREAGGYGLHAQWSDDLHHALHAALTGERVGYYADFGTLEHVARALTQAFVYDGRYSRFRGKDHGKSARGLSGHHFLGYTQTHDQVGNRAQGDRLGHLVSPERIKIASALVFCSPFVPMLFQGEEWNAASPFQYFTDHRDPGLARAVSEGRRREFEAFGWKPEQVPDPQARSTFERSRLDWSELERPAHRELFEWHRALIALRHGRPDLSAGELLNVRVRHDEQAGWLVLERARTSVFANFSDAPQRVPCAGTTRVLLSSHADLDFGTDSILLPGTAVAILDTGD